MSDPQPAPSASQDLSGQQLGDYLLIHRLGRGGMAEVYLAEQSSLQRQVAIKVLRPDLAKQEDYVKRFHNEARAAAALVHANIVQIYEVGCVDGVHFIAQEYVPGQTVKQLVTRNGALDVARVVSVLRQMAAALNKASQGNIVHRDIKPENILVAPGGEVKVADFGLARVMDPQNVDLTQAGITMGTPLYMSPEQVEGKALDHRSDLYSCGVTAFFMLAGRPPFEGETPLSVAIQHLQSPPPLIRELRPDAPDELTGIVHRLLAKKPHDRYANATELLSELRKLPDEALDRSLPTEHALDGAIQPSAPSSLDATQQLQSLMDSQAMPTVVHRRRWIGVACLASALMVGAVTASLTWSGPLLRMDAADLQQVPQLPTAEEQYWHAVGLNTVEGWDSVAAFHAPEDSRINQFYAHRAQQQLAWLYLQDDQLDRAFSIYRELSELPPQDREFRAIGQAGLVIIHARRNQDQEARKMLALALPNKTQLSAQSRLRLELEAIAARMIDSS